MRSCGPCTMCCKHIEILEISKPAGAWCPNCEKGVGCKIYETRPKACQTFECLWLKYGVGGRPDKTHVIFLTKNLPTVIPEQETTVVAVVDPKYPRAHMTGEPELVIRHQISQGKKVFLGIGSKSFIVQ